MSLSSFNAPPLLTTSRRYPYGGPPEPRPEVDGGGERSDYCRVIVITSITHVPPLTWVRRMFPVLGWGRYRSSVLHVTRSRDGFGSLHTKT